jgi:hypothetical protein
MQQSTLPIADYGLDAPGVMRNLALAGGGALLAGIIRFALLNAWTKIIQSLNLQGDEIVLDVACGRGLLLTEAVRTLPDLLPPSRLLTGTKPG